MEAIVIKMCKTIFLILFIVGLSIYSFSFAQSDISKPDSSDIADLMNTFIGEWEGEATAYFPRETERPNREETVEVVCSKILKENYVNCISEWTRADGRTRELHIFFNYDDEKELFNVLFLYDNWPGKVNYDLTFDPAERVLRGNDTFTTSDGINAREKVEWWFSEDGNTITCREFNHYETDPEDYWAKSFEFIWKKKN